MDAKISVIERLAVCFMKSVGSIIWLRLFLVNDMVLLSRFDSNLVVILLWFMMAVGLM